MRKYDWNEAMKYAAQKGNGWRLPSLQELQSLFDYHSGRPVIDMDSSDYWSSTTYAGYPDGAWIVYFNDGHVDDVDKYVYLYVRCVRGGQFDYLGNLIIPGVPEGSERITVNDDGTVTDNLTGLTWESLRVRKSDECR